MSSTSRIAIVLVVLAAAGGAVIWWKMRPCCGPPASVRPVAGVDASAAVIAPLPAPAEPAAPSVLHPVDAGPSPSRGTLPALDQSDDYFKTALGDLVGRNNVLRFLLVDGFARRVVATVNNLGSDDTAAHLWPVNRTGGQLIAEAGATGSVISAKNADRYAAFVDFLEAVDTQRAVALYRRVYPLLQAAYEDLGFPGKYFNDRVVEVIDHLLATPDLVEPIRVKRVALAGAGKPVAAGAIYLFEDPALEASSSGQKIMLRIGRANAAKLKAKLADIRQQIAKGAMPRKTP